MLYLIFNISNGSELNGMRAVLAMKFVKKYFGRMLIELLVYTLRPTINKIEVIP